jgi:hypothetical protein
MSAARTIAIVAMAAAILAIGSNSLAGSVQSGQFIRVNDRGDAINGPCGYFGHPPCKIDGPNACAMLTASDLTSIAGEPFTQQGSGPMRPIAGAQLINQCTYNGQGKQGYDIEITIVHTGGRAEFEKIGPGRHTRSVSGIGDATYLTVSPAGANVQVLQGGTYFEIRLQDYVDNPNAGAWATAFARKAADRSKTK